MLGVNAASVIQFTVNESCNWRRTLGWRKTAISFWLLAASLKPKPAKAGGDAAFVFVFGEELKAKS
jgi:hypothetical protein